MKNNYKIYVVIISIFVIITTILVVKFEYLDKRESGYIILPGDNVYYKDKNTIKKYEKNITKSTPINIITYSGQVKLNFTYKNNEITYYKKKEQTSLEEQLIIAYSNFLDINIMDYSVEQLNQQELQHVNTILNQNGIIGYEMLTSEKVSFDFNQDGNNETLYFVTNLFEETIYDKVFSLAYYIENNEVKYLIKQIDNSINAYNLCIPRVSAILNLKDDYKLIMSCEYFSNIGTDIYFYENNQNLFTLIDN